MPILCTNHVELRRNGYDSGIYTHDFILKYPSEMMEFM